MGTFSQAFYSSPLDSDCHVKFFNFVQVFHVAAKRAGQFAEEFYAEGTFSGFYLGQGSSGYSAQFTKGCQG